MKEKKNIDRLFQEKFKDFEASPPEYVWQNIHDALQEKKKRRVIPLWWRYGGVAAVLVLGTLFSLPYITEEGTNINPVVTAPRQKPVPGAPITTPNVTTDESRVSEGKSANGFSNEAVAGADNAKSQPYETGNGANAAQGTAAKKHPSNGGFTTGNDAVAGTNTSPGNARSIRKSSSITGNDAVAAVPKPKTGKSKRNAGSGDANAGSAVAVTNSKLSNKQQRNTTLQVNESAVAEVNNAGRGVGKQVGENNKTDLTQQNNNALAHNQNGKNNDANVNTAGVNTNTAVIDTTANGVLAEAVVDTTKVKPENELEKLFKEQQENKKDEQLADNNAAKWSIKPQVAPVFYNSLSQGSPIDGQFASNSKSYNNDLSVGVGVNYAITERLRIRSGVNTVNLSYSTQGVEFYASLNGGTNNVSATAKSANIVVQNQGTSSGINPINVFSAQLSSNNALAGSMVQQTGYIEMPVEMSYALVDSKFGIEFIGGVSTLFLNQNSVSVISEQGLSTRVGEAQNLNNIHFSTNVGLGFRYRFFKAFEASFEPTFKYQVNTYSRDAGNFKPYFVGLYSGISFSF